MGARIFSEFFLKINDVVLSVVMTYIHVDNEAHVVTLSVSKYASLIFRKCLYKGKIPSNMWWLSILKYASSIFRKWSWGSTLALSLRAWIRICVCTKGRAMYTHVGAGASTTKWKTYDQISSSIHLKVKTYVHYSKKMFIGWVGAARRAAREWNFRQ
jgi:hypothetical protein